jgi:hypothetical protein
MTTTHQIASGQLIDLNNQVVGVARATRQAVLVEQEPGRPRNASTASRSEPLWSPARLRTTAKCIPTETNSCTSSPER